MFKCIKCDKEMERNVFTCMECYRKDNVLLDEMGKATNRETRIAMEQELYPEHNENFD